MAFSTGRSELHEEIEDQFFALKRMVEEVPELIRKSFQETSHYIQKEAQKIGDGDKEVEFSTYSTLYNLYGMDGESIMLDNTYKAIAIVIFSTYEMSVSTVAQQLAKCKISKMLKGSESMYYIDCIQRNYHFTLKHQSDIQEVNNKYKEFRNLITHGLHEIRYLCDVQIQDNLDNLKKRIDLIQGTSGIVFTQETMRIESPAYLLETIEKMRNILVELILKLEKTLLLPSQKIQNYD